MSQSLAPPVPDPHSSYLEHGEVFLWHMYPDSIFYRKCVERFKPYVGRLVSQRLMTLLTANYDWEKLDVEREDEVEMQMMVCQTWTDSHSLHRVAPETPLDEIDPRAVEAFAELTRVIEIVNRENYQTYMVGDLPNLIHRFESAQTYTDLTAYFCSNRLYFYACYASRVEVAQAVAVALERGSALLHHNAHDLNANVIVLINLDDAQRRIFLRRCLDLYQGVTTGDIAVPVVRAPRADQIVLHATDDTLDGYRWVEQFMARIRVNSGRTLHYLLLETSRLAQRPQPFPELDGVLLAVALGRHPRVGADSPLHGIDEEILRMICRFVCPFHDDPEQLALSHIRVDLAEVTPVTPDSD